MIGFVQCVCVSGREKNMVPTTTTSSNRSTEKFKNQELDMVLHTIDGHTHTQHTAHTNNARV
jgi:hypothetical protein